MILAKFPWGYDVLLKYKAGVSVICVHFSISLENGSGN